MNWVSAEAAISAINSGDHLFIHSIAAAPQELIAALMRRATRRAASGEVTAKSVG